MGKYAGNMPGGAQRNPARPVYEGSATEYNIGTGTNRLVRELPERPRGVLQQEVLRMRREGMTEGTIRTVVEQAIRLYRENAV